MLVMYASFLLVQTIEPQTDEIHSTNVLQQRRRPFKKMNRRFNSSHIKRITQVIQVIIRFAR